MHDLGLSPSLITTITQHPTSSLTFPSPSPPTTTTTLGLSSSTARIILDRGYAKGFKMIFVLNAVIAVIATIISILMVNDHTNNKSIIITAAGQDDDDYYPRSSNRSIGIDSKHTTVASPAADDNIPRTCDIEKATEIL